MKEQRARTHQGASMRSQAMEPSSPTLPGRKLQRKCACGGHPGLDGDCAESRKKELALQRGANQVESTDVPLIVQEVLHSPSQPLDATAQAFMEPRFGHDFSRVRVHRDARAAQSAHVVNALAYTVGQHVVFGADQYSPATRSGRNLIAHELVHTVQQGADGALQAVSKVGPANDEYEREANQLAERVMRGRPADNATPRFAVTGEADNQGGEDLSRAAPQRSLSPVIQRAAVPTLGNVLAPQMALDALIPNAAGYDVSKLSLELLEGITRAESGVLKDRRIESSRVGDTQGPGQLGEDEIDEVDRTFVTARKAFAAGYGEPPETWQEKTNDPNWAYFYTAAAYLLKLEVAQENFQPSEETMSKEGAPGTKISDEAMGVHELGLVTYHGGFDRMAAYRRRIAGDPPSATPATPEEAAFGERFGISPGFKRWQVTNEMALAAIREDLFMKDDEDRTKLAEMETYLQNVAGGFDFEFDISTSLEESRRFFVSKGTVTIESSAHFPEGVPGTVPENFYEYTIQLYSDSSDLLSFRADYEPATFQVGETQNHQWTNLPACHYRFSVYKRTGDILHGVGKVKFA